MGYFDQFNPGIAGLLGGAVQQGYGAPPLAAGLPGMGGIQGALAQNAAVRPKPSFFGEGGTGRNIAGNIGDVLMQYGGMRPVYGPAMERRQEREADRSDYERKLQDQKGLWEYQQEYERANPKPVNNDTVQDYEFIRQTIGDDAARKYLENKASPPRLIQLPDGRWQYVDNQQPQQQAAPPQPGTVEEGHVFKGGDPADPNNWVPVGGAGQGGPRTFR